MRSKCIWGAVILVLSVTIGILSTNLVHRWVMEAQAMTVRIYDAIDQSDEEAARVLLTELATIWESHIPVMEMLVSHEDLHDVTLQCSHAKAQIEDGDFPNFTLAMAELVEMLEHLHNQESLKWSNIL